MKPSATGVPVTGPNVAAVGAALAGRSPADVLGFDLEDIRDYAHERLKSPALEAALRRFRDDTRLDRDTFYGTKMTRMIVALADAEARS